MVIKNGKFSFGKGFLVNYFGMRFSVIFLVKYVLKSKLNSFFGPKYPKVYLAFKIWH
jgi:hypothetical protein